MSACPIRPSLPLRSLSDSHRPASASSVLSVPSLPRIRSYHECINRPNSHFIAAPANRPAETCMPKLITCSNQQHLILLPSLPKHSYAYPDETHWTKRARQNTVVDVQHVDDSSAEPTIESALICNYPIYDITSPSFPSPRSRSTMQKILQEQALSAFPNDDRGVESVAHYMVESDISCADDTLAENHPSTIPTFNNSTVLPPISDIHMSIVSSGPDQDINYFPPCLPVAPEILRSPCHSSRSILCIPLPAGNSTCFTPYAKTPLLGGELVFRRSESPIPIHFTCLYPGGVNYLGQLPPCPPSTPSFTPGLWIRPLDQLSSVITMPRDQNKDIYNLAGDIPPKAALWSCVNTARCSNITPPMSSCPSSEALSVSFTDNFPNNPDLFVSSRPCVNIGVDSQPFISVHTPLKPILSSDHLQDPARAHNLYAESLDKSFSSCGDCIQISSLDGNTPIPVSPNGGAPTVGDLDEFNSEFITQVYNYLSLGYPAIARDFDEELSRVSGIPVLNLRLDDLLVGSRGYILPGGDLDVPNSPMQIRIDSKSLNRWVALKAYVFDWSLHHPHLSPDPKGAWGAAARRGSWSW